MTQVAYADWQLALTSGFSEAVSVLSFLGSLFVLCAYAKYRPLRKWSFTLVACLAATDVGNQFFDFLSPSPGEIDAMLAGGPLTNKCWAQAIGNGIFELASVFWTGTIALTLYRLVWRRERLEVVEKSLPRLFAFVFGVPTLLTLLPFLQGSHVYGPSGGHATWCWIKPQYPAWVFVCFYVPLWCTMLFNLVVHLRTMVRLKGIQAQGLGAAAEEGGGLDASTSARFQLILQRLSWYPFILIIVWGPASVNRVLEAISGGKDSFFVLYFLQRVFSSSQGLLNAIAYGLTRGVREALLKDLHPYLPSWCHERFAGGGSASGGDSAGEAAGSASGAALALRPASTTTLANSGSSSLLGSASAQHSVDAGSIHVHGSSLPGAPVEEDDEDVVVAPPRAREGL